MAMVQPITQQETEYVYRLAALEKYNRDQGEARHRDAARQFQDAKRNLAARGEEIYGDRNGGLIEYADVLAVQDDPPAAFTEFVEEQKRGVLKAHAEKVNVERDEEEDALVIEKQDAHENQKEIEGELAKVTQTDTFEDQRDPEVLTTKKRVRAVKKPEADRG